MASGVLPDLAGLPGPGQMAEYVKAGSLVPLDDVLDVPTYTSRDGAGAGHPRHRSTASVYGVFIKAAVKGLIWYDPKVLTDIGTTPPATWDDAAELQATANKGKAQAPWCLGIESGAASGWPGTDWIEDIVLRQAGPDVYTQWYQGKVKWTDPAIKNAFQTFGDVVANSVRRLRHGRLATNFAQRRRPAVQEPARLRVPAPGELHHRPRRSSRRATAGTDYNFFPFPDINAQYAGAVEGAGDLFGMFHDTPAAKSLMAYLVTAPAQDIWVKIGGALSANKNATDYPDDISKRSAAILDQRQDLRLRRVRHDADGA